MYDDEQVNSSVQDIIEGHQEDDAESIYSYRTRSSVLSMQSLNLPSYHHINALEPPPYFTDQPNSPILIYDSNEEHPTAPPPPYRRVAEHRPPTLPPSHRPLIDFSTEQQRRHLQTPHVSARNSERQNTCWIPNIPLQESDHYVRFMSLCYMNSNQSVEVPEEEVSDEDDDQPLRLLLNKVRVRNNLRPRPEASETEEPERMSNSSRLSVHLENVCNVPCPHPDSSSILPVPGSRDPRETHDYEAIVPHLDEDTPIGEHIAALKAKASAHRRILSRLRPLRSSSLVWFGNQRPIRASSLSRVGNSQ
jgi:hypothetical protein